MLARKERICRIICVIQNLCIYSVLKIPCVHMVDNVDLSWEVGIIHNRPQPNIDRCEFYFDVRTYFNV